MKYAIPSAALVAGAVSQATFEPADFNVTEALLDNGVNVSAIPELAPLVERSLLSGCSIAVSTDPRQCRSRFGANASTV